MIDPININKVRIVDSHECVLEFWAAYFQTTSLSPRLISLDYHTDTFTPFGQHITNLENNKGFEGNFDLKSKELVGKVNPLSKSSIAKAISLLNNDEHIKTALQLGVISSALLVTHQGSKADNDYSVDNKIIYFDLDEIKTGKNTSESNQTNILETEFLQRAVTFGNNIWNLNNESDLFDNDFILDIDLDYFRVSKALQPKDSTLINKLFSKACLVTIAREPFYVEDRKLEEDLDSDKILNLLKNLLSF